MSTWRVAEVDGLLRLEEVTARGVGSRSLTWAELLDRRLATAQVLVVYFPSRFDLGVDKTVKDALATFGKRTGAGTSVNIWDTTDSAFTEALGFFDLKSPPALVIATGHLIRGSHAFGPNRNLYCVSITSTETLGSIDRLVSAINSIHEMMVRSDPSEIARYARTQKAHSAVQVLGRVAHAVRDELVALKLKVQFPGGPTVEIG